MSAALEILTSLDDDSVLDLSDSSQCPDPKFSCQEGQTCCPLPDAEVKWSTSWIIKQGNFKNGNSHPKYWVQSFKTCRWLTLLTRRARGLGFIRLSHVQVSFRFCIGPPIVLRRLWPLLIITNRTQHRCLFKNWFVRLPFSQFDKPVWSLFNICTVIERKFGGVLI